MTVIGEIKNYLSYQTHQCLAADECVYDPASIETHKSTFTPIQTFPHQGGRSTREGTSILSSFWRHDGDSGSSMMIPGMQLAAVSLAYFLYQNDFLDRENLRQNLLMALEDVEKGDYPEAVYLIENEIKYLEHEASKLDGGKDIKPGRLEYAKSSLALAHLIQGIVFASSSDNREGDLNDALNSLKRAVSNFNALEGQNPFLDTEKLLQIKRWHAGALVTMGDVLIRLGKNYDALLMLWKAEGKFAVVGSIEGVADCQMTRSQILFQRGEFQEAISAAENARNLFSQIGNYLGEAEACRCKAGAMIKLGMDKGAYFAAMDSVRNFHIAATKSLEVGKTEAEARFRLEMVAVLEMIQSDIRDISARLSMAYKQTAKDLVFLGYTENALELLTNNIELLFRTGKEQKKPDTLEKAVMACDELVKLFPSLEAMGSAFLLKGDILIKMAEYYPKEQRNDLLLQAEASYKTAISTFQEISKGSPNFESARGEIEAVSNIASILEKTGRGKEVEPLFKELERLVRELKKSHGEDGLKMVYHGLMEESDDDKVRLVGLIKDEMNEKTAGISFAEGDRDDDLPMRLAESLLREGISREERNIIRQELQRKLGVTSFPEFLMMIEKVGKLEDRQLRFVEMLGHDRALKLGAEIIKDIHFGRAREGRGVGLEERDRK